MKQGVLLDTNVLIDHLRIKQSAKPQETLFDQILLTGEPLYLASVSIQELFAGQSTREKQHEENLRTFLQLFRIISLSTEIAEHAGKLIRDFPPVAFVDASIAATAFVRSLPLLTINTKDFSRIPGLWFWK